MFRSPKRSNLKQFLFQVYLKKISVENFYPQVVLTADDERGTKSVDYGRLTAVLIEAVKELSELVNRDITSIKKDIDAICQHPLWKENQIKG